MTTDRQAPSATLKNTALHLVSEWSEVLKAAVDEAEKFVREKPVAGAAVAFAAGWILGSFFKR